MILGGSTNAVLHLIAIAHSVGIELTLEDFQNVSDRTPFIADLKPSGKYMMEDVYSIGGIPSRSIRSVPVLAYALTFYPQRFLTTCSAKNSSTGTHSLSRVEPLARISTGGHTNMASWTSPARM